MEKSIAKLSGYFVGLTLLAMGARAHAQNVPIEYEAQFDMNAQLSHAGFDKTLATKKASISGAPHLWFSPPLIGEFGYEVAYTLGGSAYLHAALYAGGGTALVHYPVGVQIVWPKTIHAGAGGTITTKLIPTDGAYLAIEQTPTYQAALSAGIQADIELNFWLEAFGYYLRDGTNNPLLSWHPGGSYTLFDLSKGQGNFVLSEGVAYGNINKPDFTGAHSASNSLSLHGSRPMGGVTADVTNLISQSIIGVNLSDSYDILGYTLGYDLIDLRANLTLDANVDLHAKLTPRIRFTFSDGSPDQTVEIGKTATVLFKGDSVTVTPTLLVDGEMQDSHSVTLGADMTFDPFHLYGRGSVAGYNLGFDLPPGDSLKKTLFDEPIISLPIVSGSEPLAGSAAQTPFTIVVDTTPVKITADPPDFGTTRGVGSGKDAFRSISGTVTGGYSADKTVAIVTCPTGAKTAAAKSFLTKNIPANVNSSGFELDGDLVAALAQEAGTHDGDIWQVQLITPALGGKPQQISNSVSVKFDHQYSSSQGDSGSGSGSQYGLSQLKPVFYTTLMPAFGTSGNPLEALAAKGLLVIDSASQVSQSLEVVSRNPGSIFSRNATYLFDGKPIPTQSTFTSIKTMVGGVTQYKTTYNNVGLIPASSVTRSGDHLIEFRNGGLGTAKTPVKQVTVIEPQPAVQRASLLAERGDASSRNAPLALYGMGFTRNSKILIDGKAVPTKFVSPSQLQVDTPSVDLLAIDAQKLQVFNAGGVNGGLSTAVPRSFLRSRPRETKGVLEVKNTIFADAFVEHKKETPQTARLALKPLKGTQLTGARGNRVVRNLLPPVTTNAPILTSLLTLGNAGSADLRDVRLSAVTLTVAGATFSLPVPNDARYDRLRPASRNIFVLHAPANAKGWKEGDSVEIAATGTADGKPFRITQQSRIQTPPAPPASPSQIRFTP